PAAVEKPIDGEQDGNLLGGKTHRGEDQGERDEAAGGYATGAHAGYQGGQHDDHLVDEAQRIAQRLGHEQGGRRLVERSAVVVEVGANAGRQLARLPRDAQLPQHRSVIEWIQLSAQFSTSNPGIAARSESLDTTVQLPRANAMAATMMSICCIGLRMRRSSANTRPNCSAASFV